MVIQLSYYLRLLASWLLSIIAPPTCAHCRLPLPTRTIFCVTCAARVTPVASVYIPISAHQSVRVMAVSAYQEPLKSLIIAKRWSDMLASRQLGTLMWDMTYVRYMSADYFVPIPLHWTRQARRGFNQAHEMARVLSAHSGRPVAQLVKRVRKTEFQSALAIEQRRANVKKAFSLCTIDRALYEGKHLVIVDDLMTTGATIKEVAQLLRTLKPASITAVVACRAC